MERIIGRGVIGSRGANFANHMPYLSEAKQRDLMCEEDTWKVKEEEEEVILDPLLQTR